MKNVSTSNSSSKYILQPSFRHNLIAAIKIISSRNITKHHFHSQMPFPKRQFSNKIKSYARDLTKPIFGYVSRMKHKIRWSHTKLKFEIHKIYNFFHIISKSSQYTPNPIPPPNPFYFIILYRAKDIMYIITIHIHTYIFLLFCI